MQGTTAQDSLGYVALISSWDALRNDMPFNSHRSSLLRVSRRILPSNMVTGSIYIIYDLPDRATVVAFWRIGTRVRNRIQSVALVTQVADASSDAI